MTSTRGWSTDSIAWIAFIARLMTTCCNWMRSPSTAGNLSARSSRNNTRCTEFQLEQKNRILDDFVEIDRCSSAVALFGQRPQPADDVARAPPSLIMRSPRA